MILIVYIACSPLGFAGRKKEKIRLTGSVNSTCREQRGLYIKDQRPIMVPSKLGIIRLEIISKHFTIKH